MLPATQGTAKFVSKLRKFEQEWHMNRQENFVYRSVLNAALKQGAIERLAIKEAELALSSYRHNTFKKVSSLINDAVKRAVRESKRYKETSLTRKEER